MQLTTALGVLATAYGLASVTAPLLQLHRIHSRGSAEDVSLGMLGIGVAGSIIWLCYGIALANVALIVVDLGTLLTGSATIVMAITLRRRRPAAAVTARASRAIRRGGLHTPVTSTRAVAMGRMMGGAGSRARAGPRTAGVVRVPR